MTQLILEAGRKILPSLAALGRFGPFKPESERDVRTQKVETNPVLEKMKRMWAACDDFNPENWDKEYRDMLKHIKKVRCSAKDIEQFSLALAEYQDEKDFSDKAGLYLSALINASKERDFVVHTAHLTGLVNFIGYRNTKNITVHGDVGWCVGEWMKGGAISVEGNTGHNIGFEMKRGAITVKGSAGDAVGNYMKGGSITVEGDAGVDIGEYMEGGEIRINGDHGGISEDIKHGKIFHQGKLIAEK